MQSVPAVITRVRHMAPKIVPRQNNKHKIGLLLQFVQKQLRVTVRTQLHALIADEPGLSPNNVHRTRTNVQIP